MTVLTQETVTAQGQLRRAADLIEEHGHAQGAYETQEGAMCMALALALAGGTNVHQGHQRIPVWSELHASPALVETSMSMFDICSHNNTMPQGSAPEWLRALADDLERSNS